MYPVPLCHDRPYCLDHSRRLIDSCPSTKDQSGHWYSPGPAAFRWSQRSFKLASMEKGAEFITIQVFTFLSIWILAGIGAALMLIINEFQSVFDWSGSWFGQLDGSQNRSCSNTRWFLTSWGVELRLDPLVNLLQRLPLLSSSKHTPLCHHNMESPRSLDSLELHGRSPRYWWICCCGRRRTGSCDRGGFIFCAWTRVVDGIIYGSQRIGECDREFVDRLPRLFLGNTNERLER